METPYRMSRLHLGIFFLKLPPGLKSKITEELLSRSQQLLKCWYADAYPTQRNFMGFTEVDQLMRAALTVLPKIVQGLEKALQVTFTPEQVWLTLQTADAHGYAFINVAGKTVLFPPNDPIALAQVKSL